MKTDVRLLARLQVPNSTAWFKRFTVSANCLVAMSNDQGILHLWDIGSVAPLDVDKG